MTTTKSSSIVLLVTLILGVDSCTALISSTKLGSTSQVQLGIPARRMWGWGNGLDGYCGECSFQMAGIFFGNYVSEERVRYAAGNSELLIAVNDEKAARALLYNYEEWDYAGKKTPQAAAFVKWARSHIDQGHVVIAGWYERQPGGDPDYDHIMPIIGYTMNSVGEVQGLIHHDLYLNDTTLTSGSDLDSTRSDCSQKAAPTQPYDYCLPKKYDYGIAITGPKDPNGELFRTKLTVGEWYEPDWGAEDGLHETPKLIGISATIYGLTVGKKYSILRFDDAETIPSGGFLNGGWARKRTFTAAHTEETVALESVLSDGTYFYRTVQGE